MSREDLLAAMATIFLFATYWITTAVLVVIAILAIVASLTDPFDWGAAIAVGSVYLIAWVIANLYIIDYWIEHESE